MRPLVSTRAALGDDDLLGKALPGPSWSSWRTLLIACMGEPLLEDERKVFAELTGGREREPGEPAEEVHAIVGPRSGKTRAAATTATYLTALCDHSDHLAPGERGAAALERDDLASDARLQSDPGHLRERACVGFADRERDGGHAAAAQRRRCRVSASELSEPFDAHWRAVAEAREKGA